MGSEHLQAISGFSYRRCYGVGSLKSLRGEMLSIYLLAGVGGIEGHRLTIQPRDYVIANPPSRLYMHRTSSDFLHVPRRDDDGLLLFGRRKATHGARRDETSANLKPMESSLHPSKVITLALGGIPRRCCLRMQKVGK